MNPSTASSEDNESKEETETTMKRNQDTDSDSDDDEDDDAVPSGSGVKVRNPLFDLAKRRKVDEGNEDSDSEVSDTDSEDWSDCSDSDDDGKPKVDMTEPDLDNINPEDALIMALKAAKEKRIRVAPPDLVLKGGTNMFTDVSFHPEKNLIAAGTIEGDSYLYELTNDKNEKKKMYAIHKESVRSLEFDANGEFLYSGSADKSFKIIDVATSQVKYKMLKAHPAKIYKVKPVNEWVCASGDDDGYVKLWDHRIQKAVMEERPFTGYVSDFFVDADCRLMVASSGELPGSIQGMNLRGKKLGIKSEGYDGEMTSLGMVHRDSKLVAGCGDGRLYMFNWGEFGYHSADFPGHPAPVTDMASVTDNVVITGCEDGTMRAVHLYPHRFLGTVGHHASKYGSGIERMDVNAKGDIIASVSDDARVKFWNIGYLEQMDYNKTQKPFHNKKKMKMRRKENKMHQAIEQEHQLPSSNRMNKKDFFKDL